MAAPGEAAPRSEAPTAVPIPPAPGPTTTAPVGIVAQLLAFLLAFLVWLFSDKRRAFAALAVTASALLGGWWWNSRPVPKSDVCAQAVALQGHLRTASFGFDNAAFSMANRLGAAAMKADAGDGGDVTAVHYAGQQLASLGQGKGIVYASLGEFEGPLSTIQSWCATDTRPVAAPPVQDPALAQGSPVDTAAEAPTDASTSFGLVKALDGGCPQIGDAVAGPTNSRFVLTNDADLPADDIPQGLVAISICGYDLANATSSITPLKVRLAEYASDEAVTSALRVMHAPDPGQAANPGEAATATFTFGGGPAAIVRKGDLIVIASEASPTVGISDQTLTDIASLAMGFWRPA